MPVSYDSEGRAKTEWKDPFNRTGYDQYGPLRPSVSQLDSGGNSFDSEYELANQNRINAAKAETARQGQIVSYTPNKWTGANSAPANTTQQDFDARLAAATSAGFHNIAAHEADIQRRQTAANKAGMTWGEYEEYNKLAADAAKLSGWAAKLGDTSGKTASQKLAGAAAAQDAAAGAVGATARPVSSFAPTTPIASGAKSAKTYGTAKKKPEDSLSSMENFLLGG